ncbi:MAG: hypothetical protein ACR5K2_01940 [Wolbachia sp.]
MTNKEVDKNLVLSPSSGLNEDVANLEKSLQFDKKVDIEENKLSKNNADKLLKGKKKKRKIKLKKKK